MMCFIIGSLFFLVGMCLLYFIFIFLVLFIIIKLDMIIIIIDKGKIVRFWCFVIGNFWFIIIW